MDHGIFMRCEKCRKELTREDKKTRLDEEGVTHTYCPECFKE
ncbi:MAG: hypothetical protein NT157_00150 [Candidatus Micrarchaeota archaeon]|nr:hypothetical protein [Candidatus Micrarchaeota archaeon]